MHDIVIRGGTIIDGTGKSAFSGDVAIADGKISAVGGKQGPAKREIDANGLMVTPGWVDVHTHYDGQAMWDPLLAPSCWHGVTTVLFGNCGVGFAPVKKHHRQGLMDLMEGVEEIPEPRAGGRADLGVGDLSRVHGRAGSARARHRRRGASRAFADARLCDGRSRRPPRKGHRRRHRRDAENHAGGAASPARSASPRRARIRTRRPTASWSPRAMPTITSCSASARRWASSAAARSA